MLDISHERFVKLLVFAWAIYSHRNKVRFNGVKPNASAIINAWTLTLQQIEELKTDIHTQSDASTLRTPLIRRT